MKAACIQLCSNGDLDRNLAVAQRLIDRAAEAGALLVQLPENFAFMHPDRELKLKTARKRMAQEVLPYLARNAARHGIHLVGGSVLLPAPGGKLRNACPVYGPQGDCLGTYDKIHLFDVELPDERYCESDLVQAGETPLLLRCGEFRLGLSICYDLRFPELYRGYAASGCDILSIPAAFTVPTGRAHWELLLRARAVENQCFVLAAAQVGTHPGGRRTYGHSLIVDPWGEVLAKAENIDEEAGELVMAELDEARLREVRLQLPALIHRRPGLGAQSG